MEVKDFSKSVSVKVNCSFCGKEMECPEEMLATSKKHMCFECFNGKDFPDEELKDVHVDMPLDEFHEQVSSGIADRMVEEMFPEVWKDKKDLKNMSKKELSEEMFGTGAYLGVKMFMKMMENDEQKEKRKADE